MKFKLFCLLMIISLFTTAIFSEEEKKEDSKLLNLSQISYEIDENYRVIPGDIFTVVFLEAEDYEMKNISVSPEGYFVFPGIKKIDVKYVEVKTAYEKILNEIQKSYPNINFEILLSKITTFSVSVFGPIEKKGSIQVNGAMDVFSIIGNCGGLNDDASIVKVVVERGSNRINLDLMNHSEISKFRLRPNDKLFFSAPKEIIYINGIKRHYLKNGFLLSSNYNDFNVLELNEIRKLKDFFNFYDIKLDTHVFKVLDKENNILYDYEKSKDFNNIDIEEGYTINFDEKEMHVIVSGFVNNPGIFGFTPYRNSAYYISLAGGITEAGGEKEIFKILNNGEEKQINMTTEVTQGDKIVVKRRSFKTVTEYITLITSVASLILSVIILTK